MDAMLADPTNGHMRLERRNLPTLDEPALLTSAASGRTRGRGIWMVGKRPPPSSLGVHSTIDNWQWVNECEKEGRRQSITN